MKPIRYSMNIFLVLMAVALVVGLVGPGAARAAENWRQLGKPDLPAHVKAMVFSNGSVMDAGHSVAWGRYTVSFRAGRAVALLDTQLGPGNYSVHVELSCKNPVLGNIDCTITMWQKTPPQGSGCMLNHPKKGTLFLINCPIELRLE